MKKNGNILGTACVWLMVAASMPQLTGAQATDEPLAYEKIIVFGGYRSVPKTQLSGDAAANPASVTVIEYAESERRNTRDYGDLLKPVTGVAANSFDQGGVGYGFAMRGFSERSNGGNVAYFIDGVPVNAPGHQSSNGYGDLNPLIPELVSRLVLTRGPFDVRAGAFALGGSAQYFTDDRPLSGATVGAGNHGFVRGMAVLNAAAGTASGYGAALASRSTGYRDNSDFEQYNLFGKVLLPMAAGIGSLRTQLYSNDFGAPSYVRRELVENGTLSPRAAVNSTDGGKTDLQNLAFNFRQHGGDPITANAYVVHSDHDRYATRTFTIPINPESPGQFLTHDERVIAGGALEKYSRTNAMGAGTAGWLMGVGLRADRVASTQYSTVARRPSTTVANTDFTLVNPYGYVQGDYKPLPWAKLTAGVRYDHLSYDIKDRSKPATPVNVSARLGVTQPKAGISVSPLDGLDFFANYGRGFRPPSPIGDQLLRDPNLKEARLATREIGAQYNSSDGTWHFLADAYRTSFTNELQGQPAPNPPISLGPSKRNGYDLEARMRALLDGRRALWLFASYSRVDGKLINQAAGTVIPDIADYLAKYGFDVALPAGGTDSPHIVSVSMSQVWEGPKPLNATGTVKTRTFSRIDARATYTNVGMKGFSAFVGIIAYPDRTLEETAFLFSGNVGVSPKARLTAQGGVFIPF